MTTSTVAVRFIGDIAHLEGAVARVEGRLGLFSRSALGVGAAVATGAAAAGAALFAIGGQFDSAFDSIAITTGAVGDELAGLESNFRDVVRNVPTDFNSAAAAIGSLSQRLGAAGEPLEELSAQFLNLSRITNTDLNANLDVGTRLFGDWSIATEDAADAMDVLFRAGQETGVAFSDLGALMVQFGGPMRQLGFSFDETAALIGQFQEQGVNTELVMGSMRQALGRMARAGEEPIETFRRVTEEIKSAGSAGEANAIALELFGARAGPDMAAAIREGRFEIGGLLDTLRNGRSNIADASAATADFGEKWTLIKNRVLLALEPVATRVFDAVGKAMDRLGPIVDRIISVFGAAGLAGVFGLLGDALRDAWPHVQQALEDAAGAFVDWIVDATPPMLRALADMLAQAGRWLIGTGLPALGDALAQLGEALVGWVAENAGPLIRALGEFLGLAVEWLIGTGLPMLLEAGARLGAALVRWVIDVTPGVLRGLADMLAAVAAWAISDGIPALFSLGADLMQGLLDGIGDLLGRAGGWAVDLARTIANALIRFVNLHVIGGLNDLLEFEIDPPVGPTIHIDPPDLPRIPEFHGGGLVSASMAGNAAGLGPDEVLAKLQVGETVLPRGAGAGMTVVVNDAANPMTLRRIAALQDEWTRRTTWAVN